jgi:hypothetical protein
LDCTIVKLTIKIDILFVYFIDRMKNIYGINKIIRGGDVIADASTPTPSCVAAQCGDSFMATGRWINIAISSPPKPT